MRGDATTHRAEAGGRALRREAPAADFAADRIVLERSPLVAGLALTVRRAVIGRTLNANPSAPPKCALAVTAGFLTPPIRRLAVPFGGFAVGSVGCHAGILACNANTANLRVRNVTLPRPTSDFGT